MQLTLLASLAVLCTSAFAAPIDGRSPAEASVIACVYLVLLRYKYELTWSA